MGRVTPLVCSRDQGRRRGKNRMFTWFVQVLYLVWQNFEIDEEDVKGRCLMLRENVECC
jgi:hypothetical protein